MGPPFSSQATCSIRPCRQRPEDLRFDRLACHPRNVVGIRRRPFPCRSLNAQQDCKCTRDTRHCATREGVASYTVLAATATLSLQILGLKIEVYDPVVHYQQVRDVWGGVRAPDGR
jgi:hypothetical protein